MLYFHSYRGPGLVIDIVQGKFIIRNHSIFVIAFSILIDYLYWNLFYHTDIRAINGEAVHASPRKTGVIILGGGLPKHHICNANMMRNGADYAVYINTAQEFDGSDSGAQPDEAVSWGKIRGSAKPVKVCILILFHIIRLYAILFLH